VLCANLCYNTTMNFLDEIIKAAKSTKVILTKADAEYEVFKKGDFNYVTAVDLAVQEALHKKLMQINDSAQFMGEEDDVIIDWSKPAWVVDPVDGTTNLMHGYNHSAVSIALWDGDALKYGVTYDPYRDEMFAAERGRGAYLNGEKILVSDTKSITHSLIAVETAPYNKSLASETFGLYKNVFERCRDIRCSGSAALDFAHVAAGRVDAFFGRVLCPWDMAAGALIVEEAGGTVRDWSGKKLSLNSPETDVLAANGYLENELFGLMSP